MATAPRSLRLLAALLHPSLRLASRCLLALGRTTERAHAERFLVPAFSTAPATRPATWVHAASLGELASSRPFLEAYKERSGHDLILTHTHPELTDAAARFPFFREVRFLPLEHPAALDAIVRHHRISRLLLLEIELWPISWGHLVDRGVRVALVNGYLYPDHFRNFHRVRGLYRRLLHGMDALLVQTAGDAERFLRLGARGERLHVTGDFKFDATVRGAPSALPFPRPARLFTAGSTHAGEEEIILDAWIRSGRSREAGSVLALAPREIRRADAIESLVKKVGLSCSRRSERGVPGDASVFLLDTVGELRALYAMSETAYVGGSLVPWGGHNLAETIALGVPTLSGPHLSHFNAMREALSPWIRIVDAKALAEAMAQGFVPPPGGPEAVASMAGASSRAMAKLEEIGFLRD